MFQGVDRVRFSLLLLYSVLRYNGVVLSRDYPEPQQTLHPTTIGTRIKMNQDQYNPESRHLRPRWPQ